MNTPGFLYPFSRYSNTLAAFIERIPEAPVSTNKNETLKRLEPFHRKTVQTMGLQWRNIRRGEQTHGTRIALVGDIGSSHPISNIDGLICSGTSDAVLGIYVADCAAVWIYDKKTETKALLHSGKKGTEGNIVAAGIHAMSKFYKAVPSSMLAVISPCIRPPHYEMDIPQAIKRQLVDAGLDKESIYDSNLDTASDLKRFYSYRMEKGNTGRMLALFSKKQHHQHP